MPTDAERIARLKYIATHTDEVRITTYEQAACRWAVERIGKLEGIRTAALARCNERKWSTHWTHRLAYLTLEASELVEAMRGKGGDVVSEAADTLICLLCLFPESITVDQVLEQAECQLQGEYCGHREEHARVLSPAPTKQGESKP